MNHVFSKIQLFKYDVLFKVKGSFSSPRSSKQLLSQGMEVSLVEEVAVISYVISLVRPLAENTQAFSQDTGAISNSTVWPSNLC